MATVCAVASSTKHVELKKNTPYNVGGNKNIYMLCCVANKIKESIDVFLRVQIIHDYRRKHFVKIQCKFLALLQ